MSDKEKELALAETEDDKLMVVEEFSIIELEDRLELAERCNNNCKCPEN